MTERFARAVFHDISHNECLITVKTANGDYHELSALDQYHAEAKLHEFARVNRLILIESAGFDGRHVAHSNDVREGNRAIVSPIAASRSSSQSCRRSSRAASI